ncbi:FAD-dependent oxidoreductase, partial [Roseibium sp.]
MSRKPEADYDVIVAGGGAGGVGAALGAAQEGAKVLLVEKYGFLGG